MSYFGQATDEKTPYMLANATLSFPIAVYLSANTYKLFNYRSGLPETGFDVGYDYYFNERFNIGFACTVSFFLKNYPLLQAANENNLNLATNYRWKWLKTTFSTLYYNFKLPFSLSRSSYIAKINCQLPFLEPKAQAAVKNQQSSFKLAFFISFN